MKTVLAFLLLVVGALAQQVQIDAAAPPPVQSAGAAAQGTLGGTTLWYWVVARYPIGSSQPSSPAVAANTQGVGNLSVSNFVRVSWQAMPGATGYDVLRSVDGQYPAPCAACAVVLNTAGTSVDDDGSALSAYPGSVLAAPPVSAVFTINNRDEAAPWINVHMLQNFRLPLISAWTLGNCVQWAAGGKLGDAGAACGVGSGASLGFEVTKSAPATLTIAAGTCGTGQATYSHAGATAVVTGGTGTALIYCAHNGTLTVGYTSMSGITCTGCTSASGVSTWPSDSIPLYEWEAASGAWASSGTNHRAVFSAGKKLIAGANITLVEDADSVEVSSSASGSSYDPMDLTMELFDGWVVDNSFTLWGYRVAGAADATECVTAALGPSGQDPATITFNTVGSSTNDYCFAYIAARHRASGSRYADFVSSANFRPFEWVGRLGSGSVADTILRHGSFSAANTANPQGVYLEYSSAVGPNWRCVVNDGSPTETDTGVAATTANQSLKVEASVAGTLTCTVGSTTVQTVDTFPAAAFVGFQVQTLTGSGKNMTLASGRFELTGLVR